MSSSEAFSPFPTLFSHKKRKHWGFALLAWQADNKRAYLFQDGQLRIFGEEFCGMMVEVDSPKEDTLQLCQHLMRDLAALTDQKPVTSTPASGDIITFAEQTNVFLSMYPEGFSDPDWAKNVRGVGLKKPLKRHRDAFLAEAKERLGPAGSALLLEQGPGAVWDVVLELVRKTDLVPASQTKSSPVGDEASLARLDHALVDLLWAEEDYSLRFSAFLKAYELAYHAKASWQMATVVPAIVQPEKHVVVRSSSYREQAKRLDHRLKLGQLDASGYAAAQSLMRLVAERLASGGQAPRDLIDVYDFMVQTTSKKANERARDVRLEASEDKPAAKNDSKSAA